MPLYGLHLARFDCARKQHRDGPIRRRKHGYILTMERFERIQVRTGARGYPAKLPLSSSSGMDTSCMFPAAAAPKMLTMLSRRAPGRGAGQSFSRSHTGRSGREASGGRGTHAEARRGIAPVPCVRRRLLRALVLTWLLTASLMSVQMRA
eukprot:1179076-Prorocentrum_minimum.AAC.3